MRIVIDMQGAQTESRFRGIGRYTLAFAQAVVRNRGEHEVLLALSGLFPDTIEPIRAAFEGLLPQENIRVWHAPGPVREVDSNNHTRREVAELLRETFLASLQPDVLHITSLIEGFDDDAVSSIGRFDRQTLVSVSLYDLIPLLNPDQYLKPNPPYAAYYERKIQWLRQAGALLAISAYARQEGIDCLSVEAARITNVSTAIGPEFRPIAVSEELARALCRKIGLIRSFVLYTGGGDERKNLPRLIEAWSALPPALRTTHQLLFAGKIPEDDIAKFRRIARSHGLQPDELQFSGFVSDEELVQLYNLCKLYVFPSWHEGFGLPALEAMACGAPVIGANTTSLPEVIGLEEALFDPLDAMAIRDKMGKALTAPDFLARLRDHGSTQCKRFTWDETALRAIGAWQNHVNAPATTAANATQQANRLRPDLPGAIAPYLGGAGAEQLLSLAAQVAQNESAGIERQLLLDVSELCQNDAATGVQRVVRSYLRQLLQAPPPGFYVEPVYATLTQGYRYARTYKAKFLGLPVPSAEDPSMRWQRGDIFFGLDMQHHVQLAHAAFYSHLRSEGVVVKFLVHDLLPIQLADFFKDSNAKELHEQWLQMIAVQNEAICVSKATADAYEEWISSNGIQTAPGFCIDFVHNGADLDGSDTSNELPADSPQVLQALRARPTFLAVSTLEPRKGQAQILEALDLLWAEGTDVNLVFVGQQGWKVETLAQRIQAHPQLHQRLFWLKGISDEYLDQVYQASACLVAASINEGFGLPLIEAARHAIPVIARDIPIFREVAGEAAFYFSGDKATELAGAMQSWLALHKQGQHPKSEAMRWLTWQQSAEKLKVALVEQHYPRHQLLVDISELVQRDSRTGIQRVVRSVLKEWLKNPPDGFAVEPVYASVEKPYHYARQFAAQFLGKPTKDQVDEPITYMPGDIFFGLDLNHHAPRVHQAFLQSMYLAGVDVRFMVYDLLPVQFPQFWEPQHQVHLVVAEWLTVVAKLGGAVCISKAVADDFAAWMQKSNLVRSRPFKLDWFHLGADTDNSVPSKGLPDDANAVLMAIQQRPAFLMVGTLEPRKGHEQVLDAFEQFWAAGADVNLVIVGKHGWMVESLVERMRGHCELGKRLFWLKGVSDEYLEKVYAASTCLIAASYGEGFGLPLIEAAQHKLPIIARDIPVFREVAGEHAYYFNSAQPDELAQTLRDWLALYRTKKHLRGDAMPWLTWQQSAAQLMQLCLAENIKTRQ